MRVYFEKTGLIITNIALYFVQLKVIFTVFKKIIISIFIGLKSYTFFVGGV